MKTNIIIDIGNTNTKLSLCDLDQEKIKETLIINNLDLKNSKETINSIIKKANSKKIVLGSVCPEVSNELQSILMDDLSIKEKDIILLNYKYFGSIYSEAKEKPKNIGIDILGISYYLANKYKNSIGFCFGTITFVTVVKNKKIKGVIFAPSFFNNFMEISKQASLIKKIEIKNINKKYGTTTKDCLESGYFHTVNGFVTSVIDKVNNKKEFSHAIFTGGVDFFTKSINKHNDIKFVNNEKQIVTLGYMLAYKHKIESKT